MYCGGSGRGEKITQSFQQAKENCTVAYSTVINLFFIFLYSTLSKFKTSCSMFHYPGNVHQNVHTAPSATTSLMFT